MIISFRSNENIYMMDYIMQSKVKKEIPQEKETNFIEV